MAHQTNSKSVKKWIPIVAGIIVFVIVAFGVRYAFSLVGGNGNGAATASKKDYIQQSVKEANASTKLPVMIDQVTREDSITGTDDSFVYHYTLIGVDPSNIDQTKLKDTVVKTVCSEPSTRDILKRDIAFDYNYAVENNDTTYKFHVTEADCA